MLSVRRDHTKLARLSPFCCKFHSIYRLACALALRCTIHLSLTCQSRMCYFTFCSDKRYIATVRTQYARAKCFLHSSKMEWTQMLSVITAVHLQPDTVLHLVFLQMISRRNWYCCWDSQEKRLIIEVNAREVLFRQFSAMMRGTISRVVINNFIDSSDSTFFPPNSRTTACCFTK